MNVCVCVCVDEKIPQHPTVRLVGGTFWMLGNGVVWIGWRRWGQWSWLYSRSSGVNNTWLLGECLTCLRLGGRADGAASRRRHPLLFQHRPVERVVILVVERAEQDAEQLTEVHVVGRLFETQPAAIVQVHRELGWETLAQHLYRRRHLFLADLFVLLFLGSRLQTLPRQTTPIEVHEHVAEGLHVVATGLFDSQVGVDRGITGRARQILVLAVCYVHTGACVAELFRQSEIDQEQLETTALLSQSVSSPLNANCPRQEQNQTQQRFFTYLPKGWFRCGRDDLRHLDTFQTLRLTQKQIK